ncbi:Uncharacterized protein LSUE1_G002072 [Lachnellula suecica]|uniref:T6SS Phospholipase effector Tle1-like catalytic domain-containing protein n=1 Tax=Lachnellula suecica TaxID=602035 RepID=A0A8T9CFK5_9HELO|nr:Uncharacterized protein LSUE1_G002072 [Lachnellula suecica]
MPKRFVICCDGTWYSADKGDASVPSNVARFSRMLATTGQTAEGRNIEQVVYYQTGVGTGSLSPVEKLAGGAFGAGLEENIITAYHFIATNWNDGDEIYLFGFSRGAYTARALASVLTGMGVLYAVDLEYFRELYHHFKEHGDSIYFTDGSPEANQNAKHGKHKHEVPEVQEKLTSMPKPAEVTVIGVWDTVGSLGLPDSFWTKLLGGNRGKEFYNTALNKHIKHAFHALSLDEHRGAFTPTLWYLDAEIENTCDLRQCWFPGFHSDIGGGTTASVEDLTLAWMCDQVDGLISFDDRAAQVLFPKFPLTPDWSATMSPDSCSWLYSLNIAGSSIRRTPGSYHKILENEQPDPDTERVTKERIHPSIQLRIEEQGTNYFPAAFKAKGGLATPKTPNWQFEDMGNGDGATWTRPATPKQPGMFLGSWPPQREIKIKEHIFKERRERINFEVRLLQKAVKEKLYRRNQKELDTPTRKF